LVVGAIRVLLLYEQSFFFVRIEIEDEGFLP
jgi:hypothetical protein